MVKTFGSTIFKDSLWVRYDFFFGWWLLWLGTAGFYTERGRGAEGVWLHDGLELLVRSDLGGGTGVVCRRGSSRRLAPRGRPHWW